MKLSNGFWQTYKEHPSDATIASHQLMIRAGLIHKSQAGLYNFLPFGLRAVQKVEKIIREEINKIGAMEIAMSVVTPGELWHESGRWDAMEGLMLKAKDRAGRDICLSPTNEEAVVDIFRKTVKSYKQLPVSLYQINMKFRDEIRPRFGLMRAREFIMKDAYSFHENWESLDLVYADFYKAYSNIFDRMGLNFIVVEADAGAMGAGKNKTHEFQVLAKSGEDKVIICEECDYAANIEKAVTLREPLEFNNSDKAIELVETPNMGTIEEVSNFLKIKQHQSLKSLAYAGITEDKEEVFLVLMLGDDELNEIKLKNHVGHEHIKPLTDNEMMGEGFVKGQLGPYELGREVRVIFDSAIPLDAGFTTGANKKDFHYMNFVPRRDLKGEIEVAKLRLSRAGDICKIGDKEGPVVEISGIEVGHIFQLGDKYTKALDAKVLDRNGKTIHPLMGCYGIGVTRIVAAAIEQHHDENGIIWPLAIAPFHIHFTAIAKSAEIKNICDEIYEEINGEFEVLYDDRAKLGPGFKFKDADLLGLPIRVVLGERDYKGDGLLEITIRKTGETTKVSKEDLIPTLRKLLKELS
ncbi:MAG: proline--tRNA ligase [Epsilonproteobacteria bacterium]|nr:MAG: proline--tRNA ligase [Campylobacterota bacterium]RLA66530.1 MAG: proline--tRNA ligase [Campylobacterota bacterium]